MRKKERFVFDHKTLTYIPFEESRKKMILRILFPFIIIPLGTIFVINFLAQDEDMSLTTRLLKKQQELYFEKIESLSNFSDSIDMQLRQMEIRDNKLYSTIAERTPLPSSIRDAGHGGSENNMNFFSVAESVYIKTESLLSRVRVQQKSFEEIHKLLKEKKSRWQHMPVIPPIATKDITRIGDGFGRRYHPILKYFRPHEGIDLICEKGKPIHAPANGIVIETRYSISFGNVIKIKHTNEIITLYAHLNKFNVKKGQIVQRGDVIGFAGSTGLSSGSHLHYEIHRNGIPVDPENFIHTSFTQEEYEQILSLNK